MSDIGVGRQISLGSFDAISRQQEHGKVSLSGGGLKVKGNRTIFQKVVNWFKNNKETNRSTRRAFLDSLERTYPKDVGDDLRQSMTGRRNKSKPLSSHEIRRVLDGMETKRNDLETWKDNLKNLDMQQISTQISNLRNELKTEGNVNGQKILSKIREIRDAYQEALGAPPNDVCVEELNNTIATKLTDDIISPFTANDAIENLKTLRRLVEFEGDDRDLMSKVFEQLQEKSSETVVKQMDNPFQG